MTNNGHERVHHYMSYRRYKIIEYVTDDVLSKGLAEQIQQYITSITYQVGFISGMQGLFNHSKWKKVILHDDRIKKKYHMVISLDKLKNI